MAVPDNILVHSMEVLLAAGSNHDRLQTDNRQQQGTVTRVSHATTAQGNTPPQDSNILDEVVQSSCTMADTRHHVTISDLPTGGESGRTLTTMQQLHVAGMSSSSHHTMETRPTMAETRHHVTISDLPLVTNGGESGRTLTTMHQLTGGHRAPTIQQEQMCDNSIPGMSHAVLSSGVHITSCASLESRTHLASNEASPSSTVLLNSSNVSQNSRQHYNLPPSPHVILTSGLKTDSNSTPLHSVMHGNNLTLMQNFIQGGIEKNLHGTDGAKSSLGESKDQTCSESVECQTMSWDEIVAMASQHQNMSNQIKDSGYEDVKSDTSSRLPVAKMPSAKVCTNKDHCKSTDPHIVHDTGHDKGVTQYFCKHCDSHYHVCRHVYSFIEKPIEGGMQPRSRKGKKKKAKKHSIEDLAVTICKVEHDTTGRFKCKVCDKSFTKSSHLKSHQIIHTGAKPFKCKHCSKCYTQKSSLNIHARVHTGEVWFRCDQCRKYFRTQESLDKHCAGHMEKKPYDCSQCKADFKTMEALERHLVKHGEDEQPRLCEHCGKHFANKKTLRQHIKFLHTEVAISGKVGLKQNPPGLKCDLCEKIFRSKYHLISHRITHTNSRPFSCDECEKTYRTPSALRGHKKAVHAGIKDHVCSTCQVGFSTPAQLRNHQTRHTGERPHKCTYCKSSFRHANSLRFHIRKHTGEKPHICPHCGRCFRFPGNLKAHIMTHTKERPWQCDLCGKSFARQATLVDHKKSHTGEKNCICMYCGKAYRLRGHLRYHMKSHMKKLDQEFGMPSMPITAKYNQNFAMVSRLDPSKKLDSVNYVASGTVAVPLKIDQNYAMAPPIVNTVPASITHAAAQHSIRLPSYSYQ